MKIIFTLLLLPLAFAANIARADDPQPPPPGGHHRPPAEAFAACAALAEGAACTVKHHDREVAGTCHKVPEQFKEDAGKLICHGAGGHHHGPPPGDAPPAK